MENKKCSHCRIELTQENSNKNQHYCNECKNEYRRIWMKNNPGARSKYYHKNKEKEDKYNRDRNRALRIECIKEYGGKCVCCNESISEFLTIDHINNDGTEHRKSLTS